MNCANSADATAGWTPEEFCSRGMLTALPGPGTCCKLLMWYPVGPPVRSVQRVLHPDLDAVAEGDGVPGVHLTTVFYLDLDLDCKVEQLPLLE